MNLKNIDLDTLRDLRASSFQTIQQVDKELDRRLDLQRGKVTVEEVSVSKLAVQEGLTPGGIVDRCKRKGIPITDKDGNPSSKGKTAYINVNLYNLYYS